MEKNNEKEKVKEEVSWSMDVGLLHQITILLDLSSQFSMKGQYNKMLDALICCKSKFIQALNKEEREGLKKLEKDMSLAVHSHTLITNSNLKYYLMQNRSNEKLFQKLEKQYGGKLQPLVENYQEKLMDLLDSYGYLNKKKKDSTKMNF